MHRTSRVAILGAALLAAACSGKKKEEAPRPALALGVLPFAGAQQTAAKVAPFAQWLGERARADLSVHVAAGYEALVDDFLAGKIQVAILSAYPFVVLRTRDAGACHLVARSVSEGKPYQTSFVVAADSSLERLKDLAGKKVAFVDEKSTSGYLIPRALLKGRGLDPDKFLGETLFAGGHRQAVEKVLAGEADAAAVWLEPLPAELKEKVKIIGDTPPLPGDAVCVHKDVDPALAGRLAQAFLATGGLPDGERKQILGALPGRGFAQPNAGAYDDLMAMIKQAQVPPPAEAAPPQAERPPEAGEK